ncbi:MAG: prolipoprotein diacylglyceryl transferase [Candidatus Omnitrophota bacterium]
MYPILFNFGPITIYSYGAMVALGFFMAVFFAEKQASKFDIPKEFIYDIGFWVIISGVLGARVFYVLEHLKEYLASPLEIFMLNHGGLSFFGGLFAGILAAIVLIRRKKFSVLKIFDFSVPFVAIAQAIGRIGCFLNGCCYGKASLKYGIFFPNLNYWAIPTQIYSVFYLTILFLFLRYLQTKKLALGCVFYTYLTLYSAGRFIIEFFRADNPVVFHGLTLFQVISIGVFIMAGIFLFKCKKSI